MHSTVYTYSESYLSLAQYHSADTSDKEEERAQNDHEDGDSLEQWHDVEDVGDVGDAIDEAQQVDDGFWVRQCNGPEHDQQDPTGLCTCDKVRGNKLLLNMRRKEKLVITK